MSEKFDLNMYAASLSISGKQMNGAVTQPPVIPPPRLGDLSVTDNGDYSASSEGLDGYANVDVDVSGSAEFSSVIAEYGSISYKSGAYVGSIGPIWYLKSANGEYVIDMSVSNQPIYVVLLDPVNKLTVNNIKDNHIPIPTISFTSNVDDLIMYYDDTSKGISGSPDRIYKGRTYVVQGFWAQAGPGKWTLDTQTCQLSTAPNIIINA